MLILLSILLGIITGAVIVTAVLVVIGRLEQINNTIILNKIYKEVQNGSRKSSSKN